MSGSGAVPAQIRKGRLKMKKIVAFILPILLVLSFASCTAFGEGGDGLSAYEIAVENGYTGDEESWLAIRK